MFIFLFMLLLIAFDVTADRLANPKDPVTFGATDLIKGMAI